MLKRADQINENAIEDCMFALIFIYITKLIIKDKRGRDKGRAREEEEEEEERLLI